MIQVIINCQQGWIHSFQVEGHAGYGRKGTDIYCAGVSAVCQTALASLLHHLKQKPEYKISEGYMQCSLAKNLDESDKDKAQIILKTMEIGLTAMQQAYDKHLQVMVKEE